MMKKLLNSLAPLIFLLSGCSTFPLMDEMMGSWVGAPLEEVVMQWGLPNREIRLGDKRMYQWDRSVGMVMPTYTTSVTTGSASALGNQAFGSALTTSTTSGGSMLSFSCERILLVNDKDIIEKASYKGNNCPFMEVGEYANWRRKN